MSPLLMGVLLGAASAIAFQQLRRRMVTQELPGVGAAAAPPTASGRAAPVTEPDDLESLTSAELYRRAQAAGIRGRASMTKAQLIDALRVIGE